MTARKEVSEKSLELNVCAEMLHEIRQRPGCDAALWVGLTQRQESLLGLDAFIRNVGSGQSVMLQFKSPQASSLVDSLYKFSINERQHERLDRIARACPRTVLYVFPLYGKWSKARNYAPDLMQDTWLVRVSDIPYPLLASGHERHQVELRRDGSRMETTIHSPTISVDAINAKDYFREMGMGLSIENEGVSSGALLEWLNENDRENYRENSGIEKPPRFRGLHALMVPDPNS